MTASSSLKQPAALSSQFVPRNSFTICCSKRDCGSDCSQELLEAPAWMAKMPAEQRDFAAALMVDALADAGVTTVFTNPGTSEMHVVLALDEAQARGRNLRTVLCLFEGVATGAADGFARMSGTPAVVLLHLGHGLANGLANLHNAKWCAEQPSFLSRVRAFSAVIEPAYDPLAGMNDAKSMCRLWSGRGRP